MPLVRKGRGGGGRSRGHHSEDDESTPICRCRVLYLGSAVPHITKDGLQGIQEPLKELYPDTGLSSLKGIDSWLSVWSNGLLLENVDEKNTKVTRFFPIESLHYCAAVRNVLVPNSRDGSSTSEKVQKFLPLDSPFAQLPNLNHPPLFACILRRTSGIKVLECHAFICKREMAANALVRCCFHAYADSTYARQLENGGGVAGSSVGTLQIPTGNGLMNGPSTSNGFSNGTGPSPFKGSHSESRPIQRSVTPLNSIEKVTGWQALSQNGDSDIIVVANSPEEDFTDGPVTSSTPRDKFEFRAEFPDEDEIYEGDENHKIWSGSHSTLGANGTSELVYLEPDGTLKSVKSHTSRLSRPRQFVSPPPPPPPPPQHFSLLKSPEEEASTSGKKKMKKKLKKEIKAHQEHMQQQAAAQQQYLIRPASMMNLSTSGLSPRPGSIINGQISHRPGSAMSTLTRPHQRPHFPPHMIPVPTMGNGYGVLPFPPQPIYGHHHPGVPPPHLHPYHPLAIGPHHHTLVTKGTKSKKKQKGRTESNLAPTIVPLIPPPHSAPGYILHPGQHPALPLHHQGTLPPLFPHSSRMTWEEGAARGHKGHPHHPHPNHGDLMVMTPNGGGGGNGVGGGQYATIERGYHYHNRGLMNGESSTLLSTKSKSKGGGGSNKMMNGNGSSPSGAEREDSPFSTGIYRKKGHLNERAFSYSIRAEHRSRSYGSLANLQFATEGGSLARPSGSPSANTAEGLKKEREIIQMVRDLDLSGDEIERSHVPPEMYPSMKVMNGYRSQNGHGPRITHR